MTTTEGLRRKGAGPVLEVEADQDFYPFKGARLRENLQFVMVEAPEIVKVPFKFKGINGVLNVSINTEAGKENGAVVPETPFGQVMRVSVFDRKAWNVTALPLEIEVDFYAKSIEEFDMVTEHTMVFSLAGQSRFLHFDPRVNEKREIMNLPLYTERGFSRGMSYSQWFRDKKAQEPTDLWLPYDAEKLSLIATRIVKKQT